jgi:hypothetical protein
VNVLTVHEVVAVIVIIIVIEETKRSHPSRWMMITDRVRISQVVSLIRRPLLLRLSIVVMLLMAIMPLPPQREAESPRCTYEHRQGRAHADASAAE